MLALFMIALLLWILSAGITAFTSEDNASILITKDKQIAQLEMKISELEKIIYARDSKIAELEKIVKGLKGVEDLLKELEQLRSDKLRLESELADLRGEREQLLAELTDMKAKLMDMDEKLDAAMKENKRLKGGLEGRDIEHLLNKLDELEKELNDKPPVINLTAGAAEEFSFPPGKAELTDLFMGRLSTETFPDLQMNLRKYKRVDTLEIIGHTDGRPISSQKSRGNLDLAIPKLMDANIGNIVLEPGSNTDLGLMRALAIRNAWLKWVETVADKDEQMKLKSISVRCYSAAQTVPPGQVGEGFNWLAEDPTARRIEIRFIQLKK